MSSDRKHHRYIERQGDTYLLTTTPLTAHSRLVELNEQELDEIAHAFNCWHGVQLKLRNEWVSAW